MGLGEALATAAQVNAFARGTEDCRAGIAAFLSKAPPPWRAAD
jgi:methylglutaconyl-CoA hydratase